MNNIDLTKLDDDQLSRYKIINKIDTSYFVEASAGSGKTFSLTRRMVSLVESGVDISKICTITFTKAAANEFFERFQSLLSERCNPSDSQVFKPNDLPPTTVESRKRCADALANIDLCFMGTIDAFCNMLAKEHPIEIGIPSSSEVISEEDYVTYIQKFYSELLSGKHGVDSQKLALDYQATKDDDVNTFVECIKQLMERRNTNLVFDNVTKSLDEYLKDERKLFFDILKLVNKDDYIFDDGKEESGNKTAVEQIRRFTNYYKNSWLKKEWAINDAIKNIKEIRFNEKGVDSGILDYDAFKPMKGGKYQIKDEILDSISNKFKEYIFNYSMSFFSKVMPKLSDATKVIGKLTYFDFLYHLKNTIQNDMLKGGLLAKHIFERHSYFLIDESQDTNPMQTELVFYLTATTPSYNWKECNPKHGSLFIVGDPKQSIYRFRGADVSAFGITKELFNNPSIGEVLYLTRNYRSNVSLRDYFNSYMPKLLETPIEQCEHKKIPIDKDDERLELEKKSFHGIYKYSFECKQTNSNKEDAEHVCEIIRKLVNNDKYLVLGQKDKKLRKIEYSDIMVITATTGFKDYIDLFVTNKIPFISEGKTLFEYSDIFGVIKDILLAMSNPYDKKTITKFLLSPYCNLTGNDLILLKDKGYKFNLCNPINTGDSKVDRVLNDITNIYNSINNMSYSAMFTYLLDNQRMLELYGTDYLEVVYYANEIIRDAEAQGKILSKNDLIDFIPTIDSKNKAYDRSINFSAKPNCIKIANVHKVKGLQAPIVILAQHYTKKRTPIIYSEHLDKQTNSYIFKITDGSEMPTTYISNNSYVEELDKATLCDDAEKKRIEYVAVTRAEAALIITSPHKSDGTLCSNYWKDLLELSVDSIKSLELEDNETKVKDVEYDISDLISEEIKDVNVLSNSLGMSNVSSYKIVRPSDLEKVAKVNNELDEEKSQVVDKHNKNYNATLKGTVVHRLMECLANSKNKFDLEKLVNNICYEYGANEDVKELLISVGNTMRSGGFKQSDGTPSDLLNILVNAKTVMCEVPFAYKDGKDIVNGTIDLVYEDTNGFHIVDYKTNKEDDVVELTKHYKSQLDLYQKAFKSLTGFDSDFRIYHIDITKL